MILLIDNYDSFTYNLYQYMGIFEPDIMVVRNDKITIQEIEELHPDKIVLSPGPKSPKEAGICIELIQHFYNKIPILGICLGHQSIGEAFGATVTYAKELFHGKQSTIEHSMTDIFEGVPNNIKVARYHSLAVLEETIPSSLMILARTEDNEIMAMRHRQYPVYGMQFHPESIYTDHGKKMIENFLKCSLL